MKVDYLIPPWCFCISSLFTTSFNVLCPNTLRKSWPLKVKYYKPCRHKYYTTGNFILAAKDACLDWVHLFQVPIINQNIWKIVKTNIITIHKNLNWQIHFLNRNKNNEVIYRMYSNLKITLPITSLEYLMVNIEKSSALSYSAFSTDLP